MLSAFQYDLQHIPGVLNVVADALSRLPLPELHRWVRSRRSDRQYLQQEARPSACDSATDLWWNQSRPGARKSADIREVRMARRRTWWRTTPSVRKQIHWADNRARLHLVGNARRRPEWTAESNAGGTSHGPSQCGENERGGTKPCLAAEHHQWHWVDRAAMRTLSSEHSSAISCPSHPRECGPENLMLRHECHTRLILLRPSLESTVLEKQLAQVSGQWREFYAGERVMARDIRSQRWLFGVIAERNGPKFMSRIWMTDDSGNVTWTTWGDPKSASRKLRRRISQLRHKRAHQSVNRKHLEHLRLRKKFRQLHAWPRLKCKKKTFGERKMVRKRKCVKRLWRLSYDVRLEHARSRSLFTHALLTTLYRMRGVHGDLRDSYTTKCSFFKKMCSNDVKLFGKMWNRQK